MCSIFCCVLARFCRFDTNNASQETAQEFWQASTMVAHACCIEPQWAVLHPAEPKISVFLQLILVPTDSMLRQTDGAQLSRPHVLSAYYSPSSSFCCDCLCVQSSQLDEP